MATNNCSPFSISDSDEETSKFIDPLIFKNSLNERSSTQSINSLSNANIIPTEKIPVQIKNESTPDKLLDNSNSSNQNTPDLTAKKYIGLLVLRNLSPYVYFEHLWELFEPFGELESAAVFTKNNKVGVVKFKNVDDATKALNILQGVMFFNHPLNIRTGLGDSRLKEKQRAKSRIEKLSKIKNDEIISSRFLLATNVFEKSMFNKNSTLARRLYVDFLNIITFSKSSIYHMFIDELSDQGAIYMATSTLEEAILIFKALNGCLYESRKVTVDCIPSQLYIHLFPTAAIVSPPLKTNLNTF